MDKILDIIEQIAYEKGLQVESVQAIIESEILKLAQNAFGEERHYVVDFDKKDRTIKLFYKLKVVDSAQSEIDLAKEIRIDEALKSIDKDAVHIGDEILVEINIAEIDINRNITFTLLRDLESLMEKSLENQIYEQLKNHIGKIVNGMVIFVDKKSEDSIVEMESTRAKLPRRNRIKGEKFAVGENISCILKNIYFDKRYGIQIELSRTTPKFLEELLRLEVPEIADGEVSVVKCARIPGVRAKVAVQSNTPRVDAVGASVGVKGVRINAVSKKLCGENIDCIEYSQIPEIFIANALSPAKIKNVQIIDNKKAIITIHSEQKPKVIGKDGVNIRLASMLLGLELEINDIGAENPTLELNNAQTPQTTKESGKELFEGLFKE